MIFLFLGMITSCGSASLKLCVFKAASSWSQSSFPDSQCTVPGSFQIGMIGRVILSTSRHHVNSFMALLGIVWPGTVWYLLHI